MSISYAMNLGCHVICHGQDHVAVPSRGLGALGVLRLGLLDPCHESPLGTGPSLLSILAGVKEVQDSTAKISPAQAKPAKPPR